MSDSRESAGPTSDRPKPKATQLFGAASCPFTAELREDLEWRGVEFDEFDVESDKAAFGRMLEFTGGGRTVPVLVVEGEVRQVGVRGRGCTVAGPPIGGANSPQS